MKQRYQRGSIRRERRAGGDVWVWRYRVQGKMKQETFPVADYRTKSDMWSHLGPSVAALNGIAPPPTHVAPTVGDAIKKYRESHMPTLAKSSQDAAEWILGQHIEPRWEKTPLAEIRAGEVDGWVKSIKLASLSRAHIMVIFRQLFKKAMLWGMYPPGFNPLSLVTVKGAPEREEEPEILTPLQVVGLVNNLPKPYNSMVLIASGLGLRVSEVVSLQWVDFDLDAGTVFIRRAFTRGALKTTKSRKSKARLPVGNDLLAYLRTIKPVDAKGWVFPSPVTGGPYSAGTILTKHIKPTAAKLGLPKVGWHDLRHSFRSWISAEAELTVQKDMVRHADISTTANVYGRTPKEDMRPVADKVASKLKLPESTL